MEQETSNKTTNDDNGNDDDLCIRLQSMSLDRSGGETVLVKSMIAVGERGGQLKKKSDNRDDDNDDDDEGDASEGDFFIHIDVLRGSSGAISRKINSFMLTHNYFDPRRFMNFFDQVLEPGDPKTLKFKRSLCEMSSSYYELWKVKSDFSAKAFFDNLAGTKEMGKVRQN